MKRILIITLALLLVYGSVAWALERCLHLEALSEDSSDHLHVPQGLSERTDLEDSSVPVTHCTRLIHPPGPLAQLTSAHILPDSRGVLLHASLPVALPVSKNDLWREALFRNILTFPSASHLSRHLFLSILLL